MPELPEVETVRRGLEPAMLGERFARVEQNRPDLRFPLPERFAERLTGRRIEALSRRAKYLIADLDDGQALVMHLGMSGRFIVEAPGTPPTEPGAYYNEIGRHLVHDHVVFHLSSGARVTYNDVRRFGFMDLVSRAGLETSKHFAGMGIEPLGNELSGELLAKLFSGKIAPLKAALLDQRLIAGSATSMSARRCSAPACRRGGRSGLADDADRRSRARRRICWRRSSATSSPRRSRPAARPCATYAHADGSLGYFQHRFKPSMTARMSPASRRAAAIWSSGWCSPAARPSIARAARISKRC
jgi:formamidopyrimidine-DNA glycosylase